MAQKTLGSANYWIGLQGHLGGIFIVFVILMGVTLSIIGYRMMINIADNEIESKVHDLTGSLKREIELIVRQPVPPLVSALARGPLAEFQTLEKRQMMLPLITSLLENHIILNSIMVGYENGDFFLVNRLEEKDWKRLQAPPDSAFLVLSVESDEKPIKRESYFYDKDLRLIQRRPIIDRMEDYDPRQRLWFQNAMATDKQIEVYPHLFVTGLPVMLFAEKSLNGKAAVAVNIALQQLSDVLQHDKPTPNTRIALLQNNGTLIASTQGMANENSGQLRILQLDDLSPVIGKAAKAYWEGQREGSLSVSDGERDWEVSTEEFRIGKEDLDIMILAIPRDDLMVNGMNFLRYALLGMAGVLLVSIPGIWLIARRIVSPLRMMKEKGSV